MTTIHHNAQRSPRCPRHAWLGLAGLLLALTPWLSACDDDDADPTYTHTQSAAAEAAGTYTGTFIRLQSNSATAQPESGEGTMTVTTSDSPDVAILQFTSEALEFTTVEVPVNVSFDNDGILFVNHTATNPLGSPVMGRITATGAVSTSFEIKIRSGRSTKPYNVDFSGSR